MLNNNIAGQANPAVPSASRISTSCAVEGVGAPAGTSLQQRPDHRHAKEGVAKT